MNFPTIVFTISGEKIAPRESVNAMVSDAELAERVQQFLRASDLKKTSNNIVRRKLEADFGVDLSGKMTFLREQVDRFLQSQHDISEEEEDENEREDDGNDFVSDSEDDYYKDGENSVVNVKINYNGSSSSSRKAVNKFRRPGKQNKENNKRRNVSGKLCTFSPVLQKFLGVPNMARADVIKHLWSYVRENNLQDPLDGQNIICDETLHDLLGVNSINILQINKALSRHILPSASVKSRHKDKKQKEEKEEDGPEMKVKPHRKPYSGFLAPLALSDTLMKFLGTGESQLTRADVIKRLWEYIKEKNLQDPSDKKTVICDEKLKELFNVDSFHGFTVSKLLTAHFVKT